jgi:hypothetical protein
MMIQLIVIMMLHLATFVRSFVRSHRHGSIIVTVIRQHNIADSTLSS